jgi:hypothetical protein
MKAEYKQDGKLRRFYLNDRPDPPRVVNIAVRMCCGLRHSLVIRLQLNRWDAARETAVYDIDSTEIVRTDP